jgi:FAD-dependent urate hydroxylase
VRALFEDGSDPPGVLIGADGVHWAVRRLIDPHAPAATCVGLVNLGAYTRGVHVDAEPGSYILIFGKRAFFGYLLGPGGEVWWFANVPRGDEPACGGSKPSRPRHGNARWPSCMPRTSARCPAGAG